MKPGPQPTTDKRLAEALGALRSIWVNTDDEWIEQRAMSILAVNLNAREIEEMQRQKRLSYPIA